jgi:hypothetical protein
MPQTSDWPPPLSRYTSRERHLILRLRTPFKVQRFLNALAYNNEPSGDTQQSFRSVVRSRTVHCMEAALVAAAILEHHGYPPLVMSLESVDKLDHVLFVYRGSGGWGSVARSRDPGLHGRRPVFRTLRNLALSYVDPYVDHTGRVLGYGALDLRELGTYDWRFALQNRWKVEQVLIDLPHRRIRSSDERIERLRRRYVAFVDAHGGRKPVDFYTRRERWTPIPAHFRDHRRPSGR